MGPGFGDQIIATAILDRLLHDSTIVNIKGESYRLKEKRKAGLLTRSEPYTEAGADIEPASCPVTHEPGGGGPHPGAVRPTHPKKEPTAALC